MTCSGRGRARPGAAALAFRVALLLLGATILAVAAFALAAGLEDWLRLPAGAAFLAAVLGFALPALAAAASGAASFYVWNWHWAASLTLALFALVAAAAIRAGRRRASQTGDDE